MARQLSRFLLWLAGWKVDKIYPKEAHRSVMVAAPHTTNWDAYYLRLAFSVLGIPMKVAIKDDWTKGIVGWFVKKMGGVGINRGPKTGPNRKSQTQMMSELFERYDDIALVIAPEGTRKLTPKWKKGFYYVAKEAGVPITFGYLDYERKQAGVLHEAMYPSEDADKDLKRVMELYGPIKGKDPSKFMLDERYA